MSQENTPRNDAFSNFEADNWNSGINSGSQNPTPDFEDDLGFELSELMKQYKPADFDDDVMGADVNFEELNTDDFDSPIEEDFDEPFVAFGTNDTADGDKSSVLGADEDTVSEAEADDFGDLFDDVFFGLDENTSDASENEEFLEDGSSTESDSASADFEYEETAEVIDAAEESEADTAVEESSEESSLDDVSDVSIDDLFVAAVGDNDIEEDALETFEETADTAVAEDVSLDGVKLEEISLDDIKLDYDIDADYTIDDVERDDDESKAEEVSEDNSVADVEASVPTISDNNASEDDFEEYDELEWDDASYDETVDKSAEQDGQTVSDEADDVMDYTPGAADIDSTDINLMLAFGLEDELEKTMGAGAAKRLKQAIDEEQQAHDEAKRRKYEYEYEYTERGQIPGIVAAYKSTKTSLNIKLIISALLCLVMFFYENVSLFGVQFAGPLDPAVYPVVYTMVGLQILLLACACAYEQILFGFKKLFTGRPVPESITSVLVVFAVIYSVLVCTNVPAGYEPKLYFLPIAVAAFLSLVFALLNIKREIYSFNIISSKKPKFAVRRVKVDNIEVYGGDAEEEIDEILKVERVSFVDNYFSRTYADSSVVFLTIAISLCLAIAAAILLGVYAAITGADLMPAMETVIVMLISAMPASLLVTYSYPFYCANKKAYADNSTIIGESSLEEYADLSVVTLDDKAIFPASDVKVQNIRIYNNNRIDSVLYCASSVFSFAGGPLAEVFELSTAEIGHSADVQIVENSVGCLRAVVDGKEIVFGRAAELSERGFDIDAELSDADSIMTEENVVMYMLIDGVLAAKMFIRYALDPDFEDIMNEFTAAGMSLCITTLDPNVDEIMLSSRVSLDEYPIKVLKLDPGTERTEAQQLDTGIVARGNAQTLLKTVTYCAKILRVRKTNFSISILALFVSVALVLLLALTNNLSGVSSLFIALYQLIWVIPVLLTSKLFIK